MLISVTEMMDFLRCRRAWGYQSANVMSLVRKGIPNTAFHIGTTIHKGTELQALGSSDPIADTEEWLVKERDRIIQEYQQVVGAPMGQEELGGLRQSRDLAISLLKNYFNKWGWDNPIKPYEYVHPEVAFRIPIPDTDGYLVGTIDGVAVDPADGRGIIVERKTYADTPAETKYLKTDFQLHGYWWAYQQLFGEPPKFVLWDGINKKLPRVPSLTQAGTVSRQWISTSPEIYREVIKDAGLSEADYADILSRLEAKNTGNETMFHNRREITLRQYSVDQWAAYLPQLYRDMKEAKEDAAKRYPNFVWSGCWDCWVSELCNAQQFGSDFDWLVQNQYQIGTYGTQSNQRLYQPQEVGSLVDLRNLNKEATK